MKSIQFETVEAYAKLLFIRDVAVGVVEDSWESLRDHYMQEAKTEHGDSMSESEIDDIMSYIGTLMEENHD